MTVELHTAWVWDCPECGKENFQRAKTGDATEAAMMLAAAEEGDLVAALQAEEGSIVEDEEEEAGAPYLIQELAIAPWYVLCQHCGKRSPSSCASVDEDADGPGELPGS